MVKLLLSRSRNSLINWLLVMSLGLIIGGVFLWRGQSASSGLLLYSLGGLLLFILLSGYISATLLNKTKVVSKKRLTVTDGLFVNLIVIIALLLLMLVIGPLFGLPLLLP